MEEDDFIFVDLTSFSIYRPHQIASTRASKISDGTAQEKNRSSELVSLSDLCDRGSNSFLFDGIICFEINGQAQSRYVQRAPFEILSIGGYEDTSLHSVGSEIWLQSVAGGSSKVWYRLRVPASEYLRYYEPFVWISNLAKHFIDFLHMHKQVKLRDFELCFISWLQDIHGFSDDFLSWRQQHPRNDFRQAVAVHVNFLYNQAALLGPDYASHPLWNEIDQLALTAVPRQRTNFKDNRTVTTPYVFECFRHMPWASFLDPIVCELEQSSTHHLDPATMEGPTFQDEQQRGSDSIARITSNKGPIEEGDVVAIPSDANGSWKTNDEFWLAYVQSRQTTKRGLQRLSLVWLYRASDTACQGMKYPFENEIFISDHCNCGDPPIHAADVDHKVSVALFSDPSSAQGGFFIRQKYNSADSFWTTLQPSDFKCGCHQGLNPACPYQVGDTLLLEAETLGREMLEPVVLVEHSPDGNADRICVRRLLRKREDYGDINAEPNELVYSSRIDTANVSAMRRRCHVRFYTLDDQRCRRITAPYNRKGTGDCYYILYKQSNLSGALEPLRQPWPPMKQGFRTEDSSARPLRGLDIFCGGGSLGRGLEEAGAVKNEWAVDLFPEAIHTYHANSPDVKAYNGSVNDYLYRASRGLGGGLIAEKGEAEFMCAGNPCPGFSSANPDRNSNRSLLNNSLVASVISFVDFYRPKYLVMENVLGMATGGRERSGHINVFAQVLCALVGLGYQVRPVILDAWNFGAPQARTRLFVMATAPGLRPLTKPQASHSHPSSVIGRSLGKTANGLAFGEREWMPTPFEYISIGEATMDLPRNTDARTPCISYPDHRVMGSLSALNNVRLSCIPRFPPGMTFVKSVEMGWQPPPSVSAWHWDTKLRAGKASKAWQRAREHALLPTVTTSNWPGDALTGSALHWDAHRPLTIMEARRAQGIPDDEVIIGPPAVQWRIIGNGVARPVAIALGLSLRQAWLDGSWQNQTAAQARTTAELDPNQPSANCRATGDSDPVNERTSPDLSDSTGSESIKIRCREGNIKTV